MKKIFVLTLSVLLCLSSLVFGISAERTLPLVVDNADLLTSSEESRLTAILTQISEKHNLELAIVTVNSTNGKSAEAYADDFYDYNGYGFGENDDGAMLLIDMGGREWYITTHGTGITYLTDYALYMIGEAFVDALSDGRYYNAFMSFANECDRYIDKAKNAPSTDYTDDDYYTDYTDDIELTAVSFILPSIFVGFIISLIVVSIMRMGMKTVRPAKGAADYIVNDSLDLRMSSDRYLYSNTVRTKKESSSSSSSGSSGRTFSSGSSTHRSSSGRSHGGRGGRF